MSFQGTTRADPYERSLAHTALISDDWRRSDPRDRDEAHEVEGAIVWQVQGGEPKAGDAEKNLPHAAFVISGPGRHSLPVIVAREGTTVLGPPSGRGAGTMRFQSKAVCR